MRCFFRIMKFPEAAYLLALQDFLKFFLKRFFVALKGDFFLIWLTDFYYIFGGFQM